MFIKGLDTSNNRLSTDMNGGFGDIALNIEELHATRSILH